MEPIKAILTLADAYASAAGLTRSTVSSKVFGDGKLLGRLADGRDLTTRRYVMAIEWFSANWPAGAAWPPAIRRPTPTSEAAE